MPKSQPAGVAAFGDMTGLQALSRGRPLEIVPFVLVQGLFDSTGSNPLVPRDDTEVKFGADLRYGVTSNLTLAATVQPDFGQVEVDPSEINLTAFETRYEEKRPFFVEGSNAFRFAENSRGPLAAKELLYTRRIGRAPQVDLPTDTTAIPNVVDLLGAAKLTGRTSQGWTIGVVDAFTDEMTGVYLDAAGDRREGIVEPSTNYFATRISREMRGGQAYVGGMVTAVTRDAGDAGVAAALVEKAYTGGLDFYTEFADRVWSLAGFVAGSRLEGSALAITEVQQDSARFYQRPDAKGFSLDPGATLIQGGTAQLQLEKRTGTHWLGDLGLAYVSPGYEINDLGFQQRVDRQGVYGRVEYNERTPGAVLRRWKATVYPQMFFNTDGDWLGKNLRAQVELTHLNYWMLRADGEYKAEVMDDRLTRGGPVALKPAGWMYQIRFESDPRQVLSGDLRYSSEPTGETTRTHELSSELNYRPGGRWNLGVEPSLKYIESDAQYVGDVDDPFATATYGRRYVFADLDRTEAGLQARLNYSVRPELSIELFLQALISNGDYGAPKEFLTPRAYDFAVYGRDQGSISQSGSVYTIDPDGAGPAIPFTMDDLSYTTRSLLTNLVLRWEFRPGSTLYLVWRHDRLNSFLEDEFSVGRSLGTLFDPEPRNLFALKVSYWFGL